MTNEAIPIATPGSRDSRPFRVVIAGGGVAAVEALLALRALARERVSLTMVAPDDDLLVRPLSVAEPFEGPFERSYSLDKICSDAGADLVPDKLKLVDDRVRCVYTESGRRLHYDALVIAVGAPRRPVLEHAYTFFGDEHADAMHGFVRDVELGYRRRIAFVAPAHAGWTLPLYELALQTARRAFAMGVEPELMLVTAEEEPLEAFRGAGSKAVARLLADAGVQVITRATATRYDGTLLSIAEYSEPLAVDAVIALPAQRGPIIHGLRSDIRGFVPVDSLGHVMGHTAVYAVGDATDFRVKAGGIATQHADTVATTIAAGLSAPVTTAPFRPTLRAKLLTGGQPLYLRATLVAGRTTSSDASEERPWGPDEKLFGHFLSPYLASQVERVVVAS
jgi:sulfide:quinone oxidoreductase